jgi:hypothetical protein
LPSIPPLTFRYIDVVYYMLKHYYVVDGEIHVKGFLNKDLETGKYQLIPLSRFFANNSSKKNLMEAFSFAELVDNFEFSNPNNPSPDAETSLYNSGMKNLAYSTPMYSYNNDYFINSIVHGYDKIFGVHKIKCIKLKDFVEKWEKKFVDVFSSLGGKVKPFIVVNKTTAQKFRHYRGVYPIENTSKMVEAEICNTITFYNLVSMFSNVGTLNRRAGKFIDIFKIGWENISKSDEKVLGRWFVTELRHNFLGDGYINEFKCCKTYVGSTSKITENVE